MTTYTLDRLKPTTRPRVPQRDSGDELSTIIDDIEESIGVGPILVTLDNATVAESRDAKGAGHAGPVCALSECGKITSRRGAIG